ncbi:MAG: SMC-Scp complex subunit ScpB [Planctomycetaceae bacterium]
MRSSSSQSLSKHWQSSLLQGWQSIVQFGPHFPDPQQPEVRQLWRRKSAEVAGETGHFDTLSINQRSVKSARLEAALLVAGGGLTLQKLAQFATLSGAKEARELIDQLNESYARSRSSFRVERVATGYRLLTLPKFAHWLDRIHHRQERLKLSAPAMETLSIVAYRQPLTRADIEAVRGVQSAEMLKQLMERNLVKIVGEDDTLGRPYLYGTTRLFLEYFGLRALDDLPRAETLRKAATELRAERLAAAEEAAREEDEQDDDEWDDDDEEDDEEDDDDDEWEDDEDDEDDDEEEEEEEESEAA